MGFAGTVVGMVRLPFPGSLLATETDFLPPQLVFDESYLAFALGA